MVQSPFVTRRLQPIGLRGQSTQHDSSEVIRRSTCEDRLQPVLLDYFKSSQFKTHVCYILTTSTLDIISSLISLLV